MNQPDDETVTCGLNTLNVRTGMIDTVRIPEVRLVRILLIKNRSHIKQRFAFIHSRQDVVSVQQNLFRKAIQFS